jgi:general stress protein YciG
VLWQKEVKPITRAEWIRKAVVWTPTTVPVTKIYREALRQEKVKSPHLAEKQPIVVSPQWIPKSKNALPAKADVPAHKQGVAHEWNKDEAREAGRKGGQIVSQNRGHMSEIGRKGGQSSGQRRQRNGGERGE